MNTVSVILPTYNEAKNIIPLITALKRDVSGLEEILVIDDNSPDGTAGLVHGTKTRCIVRRSDHGLRKSIQEGINVARGDIIVWMDADFSMPSQDINRLTREIKNGADIAVGSRFVSGGKTKDTGDTNERWYTIFVSYVGNTCMRILFGLDFHDYTSGFVAVRAPVIRSIPLRGNYGEYFIDFIVRALRGGYHVVEVPYVCKPRIHGTSKTATDFPALVKRMVQYGTMVLYLLWQK